MLKFSVNKAKPINLMQCIILYGLNLIIAKTIMFMFNITNFPYGFSFFTTQARPNNRSIVKFN